MRDTCCDSRTGSGHRGFGVLFGVLVAGAGVLLLLEQFGIIDVNVWRFWPVILIVVGGAKLLFDDVHRWVGAFLAFIGVLFLVDEFTAHDAWDTFWPLLVVGAGALILWRSLTPGRHRRWRPIVHGVVIDLDSESSSGEGAPPPGGPSEGGDWVSETVALGGKEVRSSSPDFRGGSATAVMGSVDLDLRQAATGTGEAVLDVFALMGSVEARVPPHWEVKSDVLPLMGAYEDKRPVPLPEDSAKPPGRLRIRGTVIMGSVEIKS